MNDRCLCFRVLGFVATRPPGVDFTNFLVLILHDAQPDEARTFAWTDLGLHEVLLGCNLLCCVRRAGRAGTSTRNNNSSL